MSPIAYVAIRCDYRPAMLKTTYSHVTPAKAGNALFRLTRGDPDSALLVFGFAETTDPARRGRSEGCDESIASPLAPCGRGAGGEGKIRRHRRDI